jgi:hypothetical protein
MTLSDTTETSQGTSRRTGRDQSWDTPVWDQVVAELGRPGEQDQRS